MSKYYKHTYTFTVLSQEESEELNPLKNLDHHVTYGADCLYSTKHEVKEVDGNEMAKLLYEAGSEPDFFQIGIEVKNSWGKWNSGSNEVSDE